MHFIVQYKHFRLQNVFLFFFFFTREWFYILRWHFQDGDMSECYSDLSIQLCLPHSQTMTGRRRRMVPGSLSCSVGILVLESSWGGILSHESWNDQLFPQLVKWLSVMDAKRRLLLLCRFFIFQSQKLWPDIGTGGKTQTSPTLLAIVLQRLLIQLIAN